MKHSSLSTVLIALFQIACFQPSCTEGIISNTIVRCSDNRYITVDQLMVNDTVPSYNRTNQLIDNQIIAHTVKIIPAYVRIQCENTIIDIDPQQRFYLVGTKAWICAQDLMVGDRLHTATEPYSACINDIRWIHEPIEIHLITLRSPHTFCITRLNILTHNFAPAIPLAAEAGVQLSISWGLIANREHIGGVDPITGKLVKAADPGRTLKW